MIKDITLRLLAADAADDDAIKMAIANHLAIDATSISGYQIVKQSLDTRSKTAYVAFSLKAFINEPFAQRTPHLFLYPNVHQARHTVVIIGAGPAGLFAALQLIQNGIKPIIVERGKDVKARRRDLAMLNKQGVLNPESNYCFGEGGAGTYSDGKLYTRSSKRGNIEKILQIFHQFGADKNILYQAHPHIGTNKLPQIITAIRQQIIESGGIILFEKKLVDFTIVNQNITAIQTADGDCLPAAQVVLATGHSASDIYELLNKKNILIEAKPFALGVRIEHPQTMIDAMQYHLHNHALTSEAPSFALATRPNFLPPAAYSLVEQINGRGVFSFCMCPGGIIAPAATNPGHLVVNGWSPSKRNNPYANSGMVVQVKAADAIKVLGDKQAVESPFLLLNFQRSVEQKAYEMGGGNFVAPAQRMVDFVQGKRSANMPQCSYTPGITSINLSQVLPPFIHQTLQAGFKAFGKKMKGYLTNDAVVVATESRTSSPIRIPRNADNLQHLQIQNLYPCAEGAGYAGGIVSAAIDGERVANMITLKLGIVVKPIA